LSDLTLRVNEFFGPTFQGEGPFVGQLCWFLRLNRCNLHCTWCDTPYTWAHTEAKAALHKSGKVWNIEENERTWSVDDTLDKLEENDVQFLVISGGEPLLQHKALDELVQGFEGKVQFETAGTLPPLDTWGPDDGVHYVVSPKLESSGNTLRERFKPENLKLLLARGAHFKFVATRLLDLEEIATLQTEINIPNEKMWVMPEGVTPDVVLAGAKILADPVIRRGWNMTLRNHILLWNDERAR
jgi:7-carboxy-7-deazaguanine synthase